MPSLGEVTAIGREESDLTDRVWLRTTVRLLEPQPIVNAAANTDVDQAEQEPEQALAVNGAASRYAWGKAILHRKSQNPPPRLVPALKEEIPTYAERPQYSAPDCTKLEQRFGIRLPDWRDDLSLTLSARYLSDFVPAKLELA